MALVEGDAILCNFLTIATGKGNWAMAARVFVGNLPDDVQEFDLQKRFEAFGKVTSISIKLLRRPPSFAFIVRRVSKSQLAAVDSHSCLSQGYEDDKSADDAVRDMNGLDISIALYWQVLCLRALCQQPTL